MAFCWLLVFLSERISTNTDSHFELLFEIEEKITLDEGLGKHSERKLDRSSFISFALVSSAMIGPAAAPKSCLINPFHASLASL